MRMQRRVQLERVAQADQLAVVRSRSTGTVTLLETGTTIEQENREHYALRRTSNGWRITDDIFNSPAAEQ
jgi:hypothetical protein